MIEMQKSQCPALTQSPAVLRHAESPCRPFGSTFPRETSRRQGSQVMQSHPQMEKCKVSKDLLRRKLCTATAIVQLALLPLTGSSYAALDTKTEPAGVGATIEASDITNEDQKAVLSKLREKILPEAKDMLTRVGKGEGSNYPSSIAKELETVDLEVNDLIQQANKGGDMSNIKSAASGIEQQVNALKAIVGFD